MRYGACGAVFGVVGPVAAQAQDPTCLHAARGNREVRNVSPPALAVVIPAGPADDVADTVASVLHFTVPPRRVLVIDDTGRHVGAALEALSPDVEVILSPDRAPGARGGLWAKLAHGYQHILERFSFDVLLRLDADALLIGPGLAEAAAERFARDAFLGMLGSYRIGPDGGTRSWKEADALLARECGVTGLGRPSTRSLLRRLRSAAIRNGYVSGEHALGGAYFHSRSAVREIAERGWLDLPPLRRSRLGEDHLFALLTVAAGFHIGDFGGPGDPLALRWHGLPAAPSELLAQEKLVTHSVRYWKNLKEREIRAMFAAARGRPGGDDAPGAD